MIVGWLFWIGVIGYLIWRKYTPEGQAVTQRHRMTKEAKLVVPSGVSCPTCHRDSVERVGLATRAISGARGGLIFSRRARAQFHCLSCDYYW